MGKYLFFFGVCWMIVMVLLAFVKPWASNSEIYTAAAGISILATILLLVLEPREWERK